jgi:acyl-CoA synthetase (AMP-forming)/AMP-acid ligase II
MLSHQNLVDGAEIVSGYLGNTPEDRVLGFLPLSFDYGLSQLTTMLRVGGTLVLQPVAMPSETARTIREQRVTGLALVPPAWIQLVRFLDESGQRLPSLRYATNSGGKIPDAILERMPAVLPGTALVLMYGLTEAFRSTYLPAELFATKRGSIGRAIPGVEVHVVHPEGRLCRPGEVGELVHAGKLISQGYWRDAEATAARIRPCPALGHAAPVVWSGDLVRRDQDGCLWFQGRGDEMIKSSGHRISPTEVEEEVHRSGLAADAVAFGVPDEELGQVVHVAVAPRAAALDLAALERHLRAALPTYMVPRRIHAWEGSMPRTSSGKLDRPQVIRTCRESR